KVQGVSNAEVHCQSFCRFEIVRQKKFADCRSRAERVLLKIDGERLHLAEKERGECVPGSGDWRTCCGEVAGQNVCELIGPGGTRRLGKDGGVEGPGGC